MSLGRPVVTNPYGDIKTLIEDYQVGLAAEVAAEDFAGKIIYLLEHPEIACRLGHNGRKAAETVYNWKSLVVRLEEFYARILNMDRNPRRRRPA